MTHLFHDQDIFPLAEERATRYKPSNLGWTKFFTCRCSSYDIEGATVDYELSHEDLKVGYCRRSHRSRIPWIFLCYGSRPSAANLSVRDSSEINLSMLPGREHRFCREYRRHSL